MDDNTTKVVMAIIALVSAVITPVVLVWVTKMQNKKIDANQIETKEAIGGVVTKVEGTDKKVDVIETKLDENHKLMNGNIDKLMKKTDELATAKEKAKNEAEKK